MSEDYKKTNSCRMHLAKEEFFKVGFGIALQKNSPYLRFFNMDVAINSSSEDEFSVFEGFVGYCTRRYKMGLLHCVEENFGMREKLINAWVHCLANMEMEITNIEEAANAICVPNPRFNPRIFTTCVMEKTETTKWFWYELGIVMKECLTMDNYSHENWTRVHY
ncbi:uncharacterized protein LOC111087924 isoform X2 [Limulus polyphemus]|uniref:Uncharacterized protein LOC111087924 isoform X2 n=1 Tax=Limulus polyphemus TaxID=6850 RepID=A0ABM1T865_LIMPO|nr:uncharacterized protein LOC111087924 isoform X2 [Limulus polyphemus]